MKKLTEHYNCTKTLQFFYSMLLPFLVLISFSECKKEHDPTKNATLPAATQEGKNTIGFTIDEEVWVPYEKCSAFGNPCQEIQASYGEAGGAELNGIDFSFTRRKKDSNTSSHLAISSTGIGTITSIGEKIDSILVSFRAENSSGNNGYFTGPLNGSKFNITKINFSTQIISGEFEFILSEQSGNKIALKDGRFDFKFNTCKCSN